MFSLKAQHMNSTGTPAPGDFGNHLQVVKHALAALMQVSRAHGGKLVTTGKIRIARVFIGAPAALLKMIVVHELARLS